MARLVSDGPRGGRDPFAFVQTVWFGLFVLLLAVVSIVVGAYTIVQQGKAQVRAEANLSCQNAYNEANALALTQRTKASEVDRQANTEDRQSSIDADDNILTLFNALTATQGLPADERKAAGARLYQDFLDRAADIKTRREATDQRRAQADQTRRENPLPAPTCPTPEPMTGAQP